MLISLPSLLTRLMEYWRELVFLPSSISLIARSTRNCSAGFSAACDRIALSAGAALAASACCADAWGAPDNVANPRITAGKKISLLNILLSPIGLWFSDPYLPARVTPLPCPSLALDLASVLHSPPERPKPPDEGTASHSGPESVPVHSAAAATGTDRAWAGPSTDAQVWDANDVVRGPASVPSALLPECCRHPARLVSPELSEPLRQATDSLSLDATDCWFSRPARR